jgi:hypothetical protein
MVYRGVEIVGDGWFTFIYKSERYWTAGMDAAKAKVDQLLLS